MVKFINLTPHTIYLNDGRKFEPSGQIARVSSLNPLKRVNSILTPPTLFF